MLKKVLIVFVLFASACGGPSPSNPGFSQFERELPLAFETGAPIFIGARSVGVNSAGGADVRMMFRNISGKTIKYLNFTVQTYNAVGDIVYGDISGNSTRRLSYTGPLKTDRTDNAYWDAILYNHSIDCITINRVKITFMDGSVKTYSGSKLDKIIAPSTGNSCKYME